MREIKVLEKDKCLKIANIVGFEGKNSDELLLYLPESIFAKTHRVDFADGDFVIYGDDKNRWRVPPCFVENVYWT